MNEKLHSFHSPQTAPHSASDFPATATDQSVSGQTTASVTSRITTKESINSRTIESAALRVVESVASVRVYRVVTVVEKSWDTGAHFEGQMARSFYLKNLPTDRRSDMIHERMYTRKARRNDETKIGEPSGHQLALVSSSRLL